MTSVEECPIPGIGEALSPYVTTREDVIRIRCELHNHLESQLGAQDGPLSSVTLPLPAASPPENPPAGLTGVRKAYWKALQAHAAAQAKYDSLRAELEQLKHRKAGANGIEHAATAAISESYMPLLRQREKQRKIKAIENAYSAITATGEELSSPASLEDTIKRKVGEMPTPPTSQPSFNRNADVDAQLLDLKKALITTHRSIEEHRKIIASHQTTGIATTSPQAHIAGLQAALAELTGWMETQLTIIADSESKIAPSGANENNIVANRTLPTVNIETLYTQYLASRTRLIHSIKTPPSQEDSHSSTIEDLLTRPPSSKDAKPSKTPAEILLPYIPTLLASKQHETSLLQQSAYMRQRLSSAEAETESLIRRLAGESHLVQPGASRGEDWAKAAREADAAVWDVVGERVRSGMVAAESARGLLEKIQQLPGTVDGIAD